MKKTWITPRLVVLTKGKPDELVLDFCKSAWPANYAFGPWNDFGGYCVNVGTSCTVVCSTTSNS